LNDDADQIAFMVKHFPEYVEMYNGFATNVERSDLWRYLVVYQLGGVYADTDAYPKKPIDQWHLYFVDKDSKYNPVRSMVGVEFNNKHRPGERGSTQFTQWTFAAIPGEPWMKRVANRILRIVTWEKITGNHVGDAVPRTGPGPWSWTIRQQMAEIGLGQRPLWEFKNVIAHGFVAFCQDMFNTQKAIGNDTLVIHQFSGSWHGSEHIPPGPRFEFGE